MSELRLSILAQPGPVLPLGPQIIEQGGQRPEQIASLLLQHPLQPLEQPS